MSCLQAGSHVREDLVAGIIGMVSDAEDLHGYSVHKLFFALRDDISQVREEKGGREGGKEGGREGGRGKEGEERKRKGGGGRVSEIITSDTYNLLSGTRGR